MVNYQKTKFSMSYFLKLIVTEIEATRKEGGKYIKILFSLLMRWDFLMGKIHRVGGGNTSFIFMLAIYSLHQIV